MILIIDNYDSFTQNLVQCVGELRDNINIIRNDAVHIQDLHELEPTHIIISPGPGHPKQAGLSLDIMQKYAHKKPILGVCLGHQCIGYMSGAQIEQLPQPMHGKISTIEHDNKDLFYNLSNPLKVTRYHSLIISQQNLPDNLEVTAKTKEGLIMACRHKKYKMLRGVQFHPESIWTHEGRQLIRNFILNDTTS
uniref:Anthranilate synthase component 2 n=1 Tax=Bornetia secundiflora TaxID=2575637 RepID=A0A4D6WT99_9FLOR|nr:Anthranilate synthase component II [Bornetia secundiflora]